MRGLLAEGNQMVELEPEGRAPRRNHDQRRAEGRALRNGGVRDRAAPMPKCWAAPTSPAYLDDSLQEEKAADQKLTEIAEQTVNERAAEEFHKQGAGILGQSAEWVGSTVGAAARTVRRAAGAVGLRRIASMTTMRDAASATADTVAETAQAVVKRGRRLTKQATRSARAMAADVLPSQKPAKTRPASKARRSKPGRKK